MKSTRRFLRSERYLNTYFDYVWTVFIGPGGKRVGKKKRMYLRTSPLLRAIRGQLDRMGMPLRRVVE